MPAHQVPTAIKKLKGTFRKDVANWEEPQVTAVEIPEAPSTLRADEAAYWNKYRVPLQDMFVVSSIDLDCLVMLCQERARYDRLMAEDEPNHERITACSKSILTHMAQFGMTPASRAKINKLGNKKKAETVIDEFLS